MFGAENEKLFVNERNGQTFMLPIEKYGVKILSIGFMADPTKAIVWRGPMASKALRQLFSDADWGELDYMIVDLPPGTGDIHITLVTAVPVTGAVIVSTPQKVALTDVRKGVEMFRMGAVNVPVLGLVENMSFFTPPELPDKKYYLFGKDGVKQMAMELSVPFLGEIPLEQPIREGGDAGKPAVLNENSVAAKAFKELAEKVAQQVSIRNSSMAPTKQVETAH
jgi:ATP-binding protein involved in chromosome partitioning